MKKLLQLGAILCGLLMAQVTYADYNNSYGAVQDQNGGCPADHACADQAVGQDCWVKYCHYEPCYSNVTRCIEEQVPCTRKCCRYVDQPYEVTKCRYVPQYYTVQCCRKVPEYYDVQECKTCKRYVTDKVCKYVPRYYWKHADQCAPSCPQPQQACCPR